MLISSYLEMGLSMKQYMINKRQYIILSFFLTRFLFLGVGFSSLVNVCKNDLLICSFLGMLLGYFFLYLFYKKGSIGKLASILVSIATLVTGLLAITTLTGTYLLFDTPTVAIMGAFFVVLIYGVTKELKVVSRVSEIFYPFCLTMLVIGFLALLYLVSFYNFLPMFTTGLWTVIKETIIFAAMSLMPNLLILNYKDDLEFKDVGFGYIFGCVITIMTMFYILGIYGAEFAMTVRFPEYLILKKINIFNYISNIENILVMDWVVNLTIGGLICTKVLKENMNVYFFAVVMTLIFFGNEFLLNKDYVHVLFYKNNFYTVCLVITVLSLFLGKKKVSEP